MDVAVDRSCIFITRRVIERRLDCYWMLPSNSSLQTSVALTQSVTSQYVPPTQSDAECVSSLKSFSLFLKVELFLSVVAQATNIRLSCQFPQNVQRVWFLIVRGNREQPEQHIAKTWFKLQFFSLDLDSWNISWDDPLLHMGAVF